MYKQIIMLIAVATTTLSSFAQQESTDTNSLNTTIPKEMSAKGVRFAILKPFLDYEIKTEFLGLEASDKGGFENEIGFSIGYAYLPVQKLGFTGNVSYISVGEDNGSEKSTLIRMDGNLAYSINNLFNIKGGLNISNFTDDELDTLKPSIGLQLGTGIQINKNFGIDISYVAMQQYTDFGDAEVRFFERGLELALHATF
jgi:hypothetical protein